MSGDKNDPINDPRSAGEETRKAWEANAEFWDERMGEGNEFVNVLTWPAVERLLAIQPGERVLDVACGNGLTSRRMAAAGASVLAIDFSPEMVRLARQRPTPEDPKIEYRVVDATDETNLLELGTRAFDAALCHMALFDMAEVAPLFRALAALLRPGGRFIFAITHPCFNHANMRFLAESYDAGNRIATEYALRLTGYMTPTTSRGIAIEGQPRPHVYFDRPLHVILGACFEAGFVVDGLEERAFPPGPSDADVKLCWGGSYSEFPPVLVARARLPA